MWISQGPLEMPNAQKTVFNKLQSQETAHRSKHFDHVLPACGACNLQSFRAELSTKRIWKQKLYHRKSTNMLKIESRGRRLVLEHIISLNLEHTISLNLEHIISLNLEHCDHRDPQTFHSLFFSPLSYHHIRAKSAKMSDLVAR